MRRERKDVRNVTGLPITDLNAHRSDQNESSEAVGTLHRHLRRDPATQRKADQGHFVEILLGEKVEVEIGEIVDGVDSLRVGRMTETRVGRSDYTTVDSQ